jgi:hypothetical protein
LLNFRFASIAMSAHCALSDAEMHPTQRGNYRWLSATITGDGVAIFRHACGMGLEGIVSKRDRLSVCEWPDTGMAEDEEPEFSSAADFGEDLECAKAC